MDNVISALPSWAAAGTGAGAGFFMVKWFFEWLAGRLDKREAVVVANAEWLDAKTQKLIDSLDARMNSLTDRLERVEGELVECRAQHAQCEAELNRLRAIVQGIGDAKQQAALIVASERTMDRAAHALSEKAKEQRP